jgi:hypothetical protein
VSRGGTSGRPDVVPAFDRLTEVLPSARIHTFAKLDHVGLGPQGPAEVTVTVTAFLLS